MNIFLGDLNDKVYREGIFKPTIRLEILHDMRNIYGVRIVHLATSNNLAVKSTKFPHRYFHKYTWTFPDGKTCNESEYILVHKRTHSNVLDVRPYRAADCDITNTLLSQI
jgi:hypothetical protein